MMKLVWKWPEGPPVSAAKVKDIEAALGVVFPRSLVEVLHCGDGLQPDPEGVVAGPAGEEVVINILGKLETFWDHGILRAKELLNEYGKERGQDLEWIIPIGDNGDGWICLDYRSDPRRENCSVVDYSLSPLDDADENGLVFISPDFETFIGMLRG